MSNIDKSIVIDDAFYLFNNCGPRFFYAYFLPRFICHGILFENFITNNEEQLFFEHVVLPIFTELSHYFGVQPLIVQLLPPYEAADIFWRCYPYEMKSALVKGIYNENQLIHG